MPDIVCLGELLIDMVASKEGATLEETPGFLRAPGGAPANVAVGISRLGKSSGFIGCVGADHFGRFLRHCLEQEKVDTTYLTESRKARTTLAFIAVRPDQAKEIVFYRHPGADMFLSPDDISEEYISTARIFHFGSISLIDEKPRAATLEALEFARRHNLFVSYDPNYRKDLWSSKELARQQIRSVIDKVDMVKISEEEWELVTGTPDLEQGAATLFKEGVGLVVVSRGERGAYFATPKGGRYVNGYRVQVVETTGAGDAFVAALLVRLLEHLEQGRRPAELSHDELFSIVRNANAAGALACTKPGAIPALPTQQEMDAFLTAAP